MSIRNKRYVIVGDGAAGMTAARTLRTRAPTATITVVSDDPNPAYFRAALTNYLLGELREEQIWATPPDFYEQYRLERLHARAIGLDAARARLHTSAHAVPIPYDALLVASGARARSPSFEGRQLPGVMTLRTLQDCRAVMELVSSGRVRHSLVVGGGPLALEWALGMHARGVRVTVLLRGQTFMQGALDAVASDLLAARLRQAGVEVVTNDEVVRALEGPTGIVARVHTRRGAELPCELLASAIGVVPNTEWLESSGIRLGKGRSVVIDDRGRTSLEGVFGAGDVVELAGRTLQLWEPAQSQARVAAANMLGHLERHAPGVHYMATRLFDLDFAALGDVIAGAGTEELARLPSGTGLISYQKVVLREGKVTGALMLGQRETRPRERGRLFKRLIDSGIDTTAIKAQLLDADFDLRAWLEDNALSRNHVEQNRHVADGAQLRATSMLDVAKLGTVVRPGAKRANGAPANGTQVLSGAFFEISAAAAPPNVEAATVGLGTQVLSSFNARPSDAVAAKGPTLAAARPAWLGTPRGRFELRERLVSIGRDPSNAVVIDDAAVDGIHAHLEQLGGQWYLRDLGSRSGTWLNEESIDVPKRLESGHRITLGQTELVFCFAGDESQLEAKGAATGVGELSPRFVVRSGHSLGLTFTLVGNPTVIGSDPSCSVWLEDSSVLPQHAHVERTAVGWQLTARVPGTLYNGVPLAPGQVMPLLEGTRLRIGAVDLAFTQKPLKNPMPRADQVTGHGAPDPTRASGSRAQLQAFAAVAHANPAAGPSTQSAAGGDASGRTAAALEARWSLRVEAGPGAGTLAEVEATLFVGSGADCRLRLPDPGLAAVHVEVRLHGGGAWVRCFAPASKGGVALGSEYVPLSPGERMQLASTTLVLERSP